MTQAAIRVGVAFRYGCSAREIATKNNRIAGLVVEQAGARATLPADAIVLACGGFQGNAEMMRTHLGKGGETMRLIAPGTRFNTGDGIAMALQLSADKSGDWSGIHCEPVDARSKNSAPVVLVYPYGIVVDKTGQRTFDEGGGLMHEAWEWLARNIHFKMPGSIAYAILDSRLLDIADYQRAIRSEVAPVCADTLAELAKLIDVDAGAWPPPSPTSTPHASAIQAHSTRPSATPGRRCSRRSRTGRARSACRRSSPIRWSAPSPIPSAALPPTLAPACCARASLSPACSPPARSPGISMRRHQTLSRSCAPLYSAGLQGAKRLKIWHRGSLGLLR
jgi:hypothetical protein